MRSILASFLVLGLVACTKDADGDGFKADNDCNDDDATINKDAPELCDGIDNNCDGMSTRASPIPSTPMRTTTPTAIRRRWPSLFTGRGLSTTPTTATTRRRLLPGRSRGGLHRPERLQRDGSVGYADVDGDGWAACEDCDDTDETRSPSATEVCDEIDNNCNGVVDIDATEVPSWYLDYDGDGFGDATVSVDQCEPPARFVDNANDCDDSSALALPGGIEVCDNLDNDCDGEVDGQDSEGAQAFYTDSDGDGYGVDSTQVFICFPDSDQVADPGDCDDTNEAVSPGAEEVCNDGIDNDCDGTSEGCEVEAEELSDVILRGEASQDYAGRSITGVGDLNNDGIDDVVVGADGYANEGAAYIYGPLTGGTDTTLDVVSHLVVEGSSSAGSAGSVRSDWETSMEMGSTTCSSRRRPRRIGRPVPARSTCSSAARSQRRRRVRR